MQDLRQQVGSGMNERARDLLKAIHLKNGTDGLTRDEVEFNVPYVGHMLNLLWQEAVSKCAVEFSKHLGQFDLISLDHILEKITCEEKTT